MHIDLQHFTPWSALFGGLMIGLASAALLALLGRVAGISGILGGALQGADRRWRLAFIAGLLAAPLIYRMLFPLPAVRIDSDWVPLVLAGLLVGFGTRLGSGCTSGHGVCGLSRASIRSLAATLCFMLTGMITVFLTHHLFAR